MKWFYFSILAGALFATGCVDIEVNTNIQGDGAGVQRWKFTTTALLAGEIRKKVENNPFFDPKKAKIVDEYLEGDYILQAEVPFQNVSELNDRDRIVEFTRSGMLRKTYTYSETWNRSGSAGGLLAEHAGGIVPVTMKVSVEMPGSIIDGNADAVKGSVARWTIPINELLTTRKLEVTSRQWNLLLIIPMALLLLSVIAALVFLLARKSSVRRRSFSPAAVCSACGKANSPDAAFCNSCGAKLQQA